MPLSRTTPLCADPIVKDIPCHLQNARRTKNAKIALDTMIAGTGRSTYLAKAPEVPIKTMAKLISSKWEMWERFIYI